MLRTRISIPCSGPNSYILRMRRIAVSAVWVHETFHFVGPKAALDLIAQQVLGVGLAEL